MALFIVLLLFALLIVFWLLLNSPPQKSAAFLVASGPVFLMVMGGLLTLLKRGAIGMPLFLVGLSWWRRSRAVRPITASSGKQKSTVRSIHLEMELDHDTGEINGRILTGAMEGTLLSSLTEEELLTLYRKISSDADSATLLTSFLDRYHPRWRDNADTDSFHNEERGPNSQDMSKREAYEILGLESGASQQEIHQAWRRLIKAVHPDHGGSSFLTKRINKAKEILLNQSNE